MVAYGNGHGFQEVVGVGVEEREWEMDKTSMKAEQRGGDDDDDAVWMVRCRRHGRVDYGRTVVDEDRRRG